MFRKKFFVIFILALILGGYFVYKNFAKKEGEVRYVTVAAAHGTLVVSISGTGQVSASNQVDIKPKAQGDVVYVGVKKGQEVKSGALIAQLDATEAQKAVRDADANLESAKISLEKLKKPADALSLLQAENALLQAKDNLTKLKLSQEITLQRTFEAKKKAEDDLKKSQEDGFNAVSNAFLDLPTVMAGLEDVFFTNTFDRAQDNLSWYANQTSQLGAARDKAMQYRDMFIDDHNKARSLYDKNFADYRTVSRDSETQVIESLISETYDTVKMIAEALKTSSNYIDFVQDDMKKYGRTVPQLVSTHRGNIDSYTKTANDHLSSLFSIQTTVLTSKDAIVNSDRDIEEMNQNQPLELAAAEQAIKEKDGSLSKIKAGADALDVQSSELTVKQRENVLLDAKEKLADYFVRAPFDGVVAEFNVKKGDAVSSGTTLATLITKQKIAEISLNEVDVAKAKVGQKATLTFDAVPNLTITGQVAEIGVIGTVSQGVSTYDVKIALDTQDERVKPSMSVSAAIVTQAKPNVLIVPNSAVKTQAGVSYVEIIEGDVKNKNSPRRQTVETGAANDEFTEITQGLNEGDVVVTRTIQPNFAQPTQTQTRQQQGGMRMPSFPGGFR